MEDTSYLEPDFDPRKLKVAELRRVLLAHDVAAPSTAKKQQLVDLFLSGIKPRAGELLAQRANVKPSSVGITRVGSGHAVSRSQSVPTEASDNAAAEAEAAVLPMVTPSRRKGRGKAAAKVIASDADDEASAIKSPRAKGGRARRETIKRESLMSSDDEEQVFTTPATRPRARANRSLPDPPVETPVPVKTEAHATADSKDDGSSTDTATKARSTKRRIGQPRKSAAALVASVVEPLADPSSPERDLELVHEAARIKNRAIADATARAISARKAQPSTGELPVGGGLDRGSVRVDDAYTMVQVTLSQLLANEEDVRDNSAHRRRGARETHSGAGYFSDDNPFQSGNEASPDDHGARRRAETAKQVAKKMYPKVKQEEPREQMKPQEDAENSPFYEPFTAPSTSRHANPMARQTRRAPPARVTKPSRSLSALPPTSVAPLSWCGLVFIIVSFLLAANLVWYRHQKMQLGYCDTGVVPPESKHNGLLGVLQEPTCTLCPLHATCSQGRLEGCTPGYLLREHPLHRYWPFSAACVPDTEREIRIHSLVYHALQIVAEHTGLVECGALQDARHLPLARLGDRVQTTVGQSMSKEQFDDAWSAAAHELVSHADELALEVTKEDNGQDMQLVASTAPVYPLGCRIQRGITQLVLTYMMEIAGMLLAITGYWYIRTWFQNKSHDSALATAMVEQVLDSLCQQDYLHRTDPAQHPHAAVSIAHLRDLLLRDIHDLARRQRIWARVQRIVERNSNVRTSVQELRGEQTRTWTWVGTVIPPATTKSNGKLVHAS
ncbi:Man1-Src1p-C-terminal domain-containing protein [Syncephalis pseudoplumigaleata]|uniref:Man1-Src1p-C-terminal domain-containing protein n=1 Tax=Syncephalis pseudoplumigaleata TaxID=1712513 RepID=A0A4P9Z3U2_9FUNG|nr:Man1-Src1p-C-terminal domain-containing protein [Syncephalis pseudoplumigaleata]|eukprot:RKP26702.1 Man1-Src1p-C-terminal domain-containing protein [Syncephalis pseudoplumigaleata]